MTDVDLQPVSEQTIVVTGASSGIGLTTAKMAAERGANLVLAARSEDALEEVTDEINEREGGAATYVVADVRDRDDVREIASVAQDTYDGFDTWVNCAAAFLYGTLEETPVEDMREQFETNVWGLLYGSLEAADHLREDGGAIVNVGSVASDRAMPLQGSYSASKHAVKAFTEALRMELEHDGAPISVSLIKPAAIDTPYPEHAKNYMDKEADLPAPVYAPEEAARAILHAAEQPERDVVVGGGGRALLGLDRVASGLVDRFMEAVYYDEQRTDRIPTGEERDILEEPVGEGEARGDYEGHVAERSLYTRARLNRSQLAAAIAGGLGAAIAFRRYRARRRRGEEPLPAAVEELAEPVAEAIGPAVAEELPEPVLESLPEPVVQGLVGSEAEPGRGVAARGELFRDPVSPEGILGLLRPAEEGERGGVGRTARDAARAVTGLLGRST